MEARAVLRFARIAPRKVRIVLDLIKGKDVDEALSILRFTPKAASRVVEKLVKSAVANAENNNNMDRDSLYISKAYADQGPTLKRFRARAMGRANMIRKRTSHITVVVSEKKEG
ncbi:50S ribosomal protein L22 [Koleobacter methoxysyntrophicus]|uniref:Large ribosomal subunit protein uL22 n=1 Tax=Koleobacter methoxysyntrophicus TaxID=2751313 RepID=A0A8A0RM53_9FIRM|nr:50S ribosomal protein L22 [Koleobacter methoxysyntrophicus]QSQ08972.1 50S ribosomal protein L22 [Koleobacter methoxysyntrophicus]